MLMKRALKLKPKTEKTKTKTIKFGSKLFFAIIAVVLIVAIAFAVFYFAFPAEWNKFIAMFQPAQVQGNPDGDLAVHFLDVGQGDCIIVQLPDGKNMIIDAGGDADNTTKEKCETRILSNIDDLKIKTFDYMLLTHTDSDHVDYMDSVLQKYEVKNIYRPAFNSKSEAEQDPNSKYATAPSITYDNFVKAANAESGANIEYNIGKKSLSGAGYLIDMYGVGEELYTKEKVGANPDAYEANRVSPYTILSYNSEAGAKKIMFTGDAEGKSNDGKSGNNAEKYFLENSFNNTMDIDVLKVGHHGSAASASNEFLNKIDPEYAIISVGVESPAHKHPRAECLERLANYKDVMPDKDANSIKTYMTKEYGDIVLRINKTGTLKFETDIQKAA